MRAWKRILALTLSIAMIFGCLSVGSYATNEAFDFVVTKVEKYSEETHAILEGEIASAKPGEVIVATVSIVNNTDEDVEVGSYGVGLKYDEKVLTPYTDSTAPKKTPFYKGISYDVSGSNFIAGVKEQGLVKPTGATADGVTVEGRSSTELGKIAFKVAANAEKANTLFQIDDTLDDNELSNCDKVALTFKAGEPFSLFINGVAPELDYVEVTDATGNVLAYSKSETGKYADEKRADTVTLDSKTSYTYYVKAYSKKGTDITNQVQWSISHDQTKTVGAQLDETDKENKIVKVTIPEKGGRPNGVTLSEITAKMPEAETSKTAKILYRRADSIPTSANISLREGSSASLQVPGTDAADVTAQFDAVVYDQFGEDITRTALGSSCYWYVESANAGSPSTTGISMVYNTGLLTVSSNALSTVQNGNTNYTVFIRANGGKRVGTYPITVSLSDRVPTSIEITGGASTLAVPKTGEQAATATYTATVYDQYGDVIADPGTIKWYLEADDESQPFGTGNESQFIVMKEFAQTFAEGSTSRDVTVKAICGDASSTTTLTLTREKARATRIAMEDITIAVPKSGEAEVTRSYLEVYDQYDIKMGSPTFEKTTTPNTLNGVTFTDDKITVTSAAAGNTFTNGECKFPITVTYNESGKPSVTDTKTITLKRQPSVATAITYNDTETTVVPTDDAQVPTKAAPAVEDQYGLLMNNATVETDGALPTGIVLKNGELYITKAAVAHFGGERKVQVFVGLKCAPATNTVKLRLELANAQTNPQSAEITGTASIAKPTGEQTNTAGYGILNNEIKDQYGLPITFEPSKLTMKLYSDAACERDVMDGPVTLSGNTITVTSGAVVGTKYYLKASYQVGTYSPIQCAPVKEITIVDKTVSNTLTVTQGDFTYGETVSPSVSNRPAGAGAITYTYVGRDGTTYNSSDAPTNAGKYTVTATCEDANYIYTGSAQFEIKPKALTDAMLTIQSSGFVYNGQNQSPAYEVKDGTAALNANAHYDVTGGSTGKDAGAYTLRITGKDNYTGSAEQRWSIEKATLTVTGADIPAINYDPSFNGALNVNSVIFSGLMSGETLAKGTDYTVSGFTNAKNAGTHRGEAAITVTLNENGTAKNYQFAGSTALLDGRRVVVSGDVTINKISHQNETAAAAGKYGSTVRVPLAEYLPDGWSVQQSAISVDSNGNGNVHKSYRLDGTTLVVELNNSEALVGKYVKITLPVASTNYNNFNITVTVTVQGKETQTITASDLNVTYGDAGVKLNASALDNAKLTYQVTEGKDVVTVDTNGNVTLLKSGIAKIEITAAETEDYGVGTKLVTVTVAKRSLTVKADDLTAYVGGQQPALTYTVTGLVNGDTLTVPELELKDVPAGVDPMKTAGTYTIGFKTAPEADPYKYDLTVETGTLTVSSRPNVNPVPAGNSIKLEETAGGKITSSVSRATKGTTVTITVKPDAGYQLEELEVLDKNGESLPLKELANGKFSFQMPDSKVTVQASFVQESTYAGYPDVLPQDWFYSSVRYVTERGLMNGTPNGFEPNMDSSRATIWTILARFSGVDTTVVSGEWYAVARQWAMENGVSDGTNPNGVITREQLATMLYRFAKNKGLVQEPVTADLSVFVDAGQISDYALDAMRWAVSVGLLNGMDGNRLAPQGSAARAQVAAMLMRFDQLAK